MASGLILLLFFQAPLEAVPTEFAPLAGQVGRIAKVALAQGMDKGIWDRALRAKDGEEIQEVLDPSALLELRINPEGRVKIARGPGQAELKIGKAVPFLVKVVNGSGGQQRLKPILKCPGTDKSPVEAKWREGEPGLGQDLNGWLVEYRLLMLKGTEAGLFEVVIAVEAGQGTQDLGFRGEAPVLLRIRP